MTSSIRATREVRDWPRIVEQLSEDWRTVARFPTSGTARQSAYRLRGLYRKGYDFRARGREVQGRRVR